MVYPENLALRQLRENSWVDCGTHSDEEVQDCGDDISDGSDGEDYVDLTEGGTAHMRAPENHFGPVTIGTTVTSLWNLNTSLVRQMGCSGQGPFMQGESTLPRIPECQELQTLLDTGDFIEFAKSRSKSGRYKIRRFKRPLPLQPTSTQAPMYQFTRGQLIAPPQVSQAQSQPASTCHGLNNIHL